MQTLKKEYKDNNKVRSLFLLLHKYHTFFYCFYFISILGVSVVRYPYMLCLTYLHDVMRLLIFNRLSSTSTMTRL